VSDANAVANTDASKAANPAFTETTHADLLCQLWDTATAIGAGKEQQ
jgi:hypothetical protein